VLFERFISRKRNEPPDIDFEHERREEVIQYLYRKYGRVVGDNYLGRSPGR
jgi:error-prone DNA polymerase